MGFGDRHACMGNVEILLAFKLVQVGLQSGDCFLVLGRVGITPAKQGQSVHVHGTRFFQSVTHAGRRLETAGGSFPVAVFKGSSPTGQAGGFSGENQSLHFVGVDFLRSTDSRQFELDLLVSGSSNRHVFIVPATRDNNLVRKESVSGKRKHHSESQKKEHRVALHGWRSFHHLHSSSRRSKRAWSPSGAKSLPSPAINLRLRIN